jgi:hypothetical protein
MALLSGSLAASGTFGGAAGARQPTAPEAVPAEAFQAIVTSSPGLLAEPSNPESTPEPVTPLTPTPDPTPMASPTLEPTPIASPTPEPTPLPAPPEIVRFRPRDGWTAVSRAAEVSVRFTVAMDPAVTQQAFHALIDGAVADGTYRWAEGDTVLVLSPVKGFPYGALVELSVDGSATSADGIEIHAPGSVTFVVEPKPTPTPTPTAPAATSGWRWPLVGRITQRFGESLTKYGYHYGLDIAGDTGDVVRAARAGRVVLAGRADACGGLQVRIDHGNGVTSWYRHLSRVASSVGEQVEAGSIIGRVGSTGCSTGPHLHFAIRRGSTFLDPLGFLPYR